MKKIFLIIFTLIISLASSSLYAWTFDTHKLSVIKAFEYMKSDKATFEQEWMADYLESIGGPDIAIKIGDKNGDTDKFEDTKLGSWWMGYWTSMFGNNFTAFNHFITMFREGDYGNAYSGYSYKYSLEDGFWGRNGLLKTAFYNKKVKNKGNAGNKISSPENGKGIIDAYRFKSQESGKQSFYSNTPDSNYKKYQNMIFEPSSNAAAYWYKKTLSEQTPETVDARHIEYLGHVMHMINDSSVTHHVWNTLDHNHTTYETWVTDNLDQMYDQDRVSEIITEFKESYNITVLSDLRNLTIQEILVSLGQTALNDPSPLYSKEESVWLKSGKEGFSASVAANIILIEKYGQDLFLTDESLRKF